MLWFRVTELLSYTSHDTAVVKKIVKIFVLLDILFFLYIDCLTGEVYESQYWLVCHVWGHSSCLYDHKSVWGQLLLRLTNNHLQLCWCYAYATNFLMVCYGQWMRCTTTLCYVYVFFNGFWCSMEHVILATELMLKMSSKIKFGLPI